MTILDDDPRVLDLVREALDSCTRAEFVLETARKAEESEEDAARRAIRDEATGVYGRHYLQEALAIEAERVERYRRDLSCVLVDVDNFRALRESYGEKADAVLKEIAALLAQSLRGADVVARCGDNRFCVLLPETSLEGAMSGAERLRFAIASRPFRMGERHLSLTASFGLSFVDATDDLRPEAIMGRAEAALRRAKAEGKNAVAADVSRPDARREGEEPAADPAERGAMSEHFPTTEVTARDHDDRRGW